MADPNLGSVGKHGLVHSGGYVREEFHRRLQGRKWYLAAREMRENSATISTSIRLISALLQGVKWHAEPAECPHEDQQEAHEARADLEAQYLEQVHNDMDAPFRKVIGCAVDDGLTFGFAPQEIVHKIRKGPNEPDKALRSKYTDGRYGIRELGTRAPESTYKWEIDEQTDETLGWYQRAQSGSYETTLISRSKLWLFRPDAPKDNPEGRAITRHCYRTYYQLKTLEEHEIIGIERESVGIPEVGIPKHYFGATAGSAEAKVRDDLFQQAKHLRANRLAAVVKVHETDPRADGGKGGPSGFSFGLLTTGGRRAIDIGPPIERKETRLAMIFLTQFLFLGTQEAGGSRALGESFTTMFSATLGALLDDLEESYNAEVVQPLYELNGVPAEFRAKWTRGEVEKEDLVGFADTLLKLVTAGVLTPDDGIEDLVRRKVELPDRVEDSDLLPPPIPMDDEPMLQPADVPARGQPVEDPTGNLSTEVRDTALNGAQVTSLVGVIEQMSAGVLSDETGRALIAAAFPGIEQRIVDEMISGIIARTPEDQAPERF